MKVSGKIFAMLLAACASLAVRAESLCLEHPIRFSHYEFGLLFSEGLGGIDDDIQNELERRSGCKFLVDVRPRARIWYELETGTVDMAGSGVQTPARDKFAWFAHYVLEDNKVYLGPKVPASVNSMESFLNETALTLGGVRSFSYSPYYDQQVEKLAAAGRFSGTVDPAMLHRMFAIGRFDAFIASQMVSLHYFKQLKIKMPPRIVDWDPGQPTPSGLVISRKSFTPAQGAAWQKLIQEMLADGTVKKILVRQMGKEWAPAAEYSGIAAK